MNKTPIKNPLMNDLGVYVHWPFCRRICPYCDFNVYKERTIDDQLWIGALRKELEYWHQQTAHGPRPLKSLYFGGGTPSLAPISVIGGVIEVCTELWGFETAAEITLEANPADFQGSQMSALRDAGINRLSLGVQSFRDDQLKFLGRDHDGVEALKAIEAAQHIFESLTFDLIYGLPDQSLEHWREDLQKATKLGSDHLSLYQLTIEQGTAFSYAQKRGDWIMQDHDSLAQFYEVAVEHMKGAGYAHYEISNFAKPNKQARHNLLYWRYQDYIGIGPGAHGRIGQAEQRSATETYRKPDEYLKACMTYGHGTEQKSALTAFEQMQERFSLGLRLEVGIDLFEDDYFFNDKGRRKNLEDLCQDGLLSHANGRLKASERGRVLLDSVLSALGL